MRSERGSARLGGAVAERRSERGEHSLGLASGASEVKGAVAWRTRVTEVRLAAMAWAERRGGRRNLAERFVEEVTAEIRAMGIYRG